jgi:hypothetical protein
MGVILAWGCTVYCQFELLAGKSTPHEFLQLIIYKATTFSEEIDKIAGIPRAHTPDFFYFLPSNQEWTSAYRPEDGEKCSTAIQDYFVEVDVVMGNKTPLWKAHDISQQLQDRIKVLPQDNSHHSMYSPNNAINNYLRRWPFRNIGKWFDSCQLIGMQFWVRN